jgi:hypothetical protein
MNEAPLQNAVAVQIRQEITQPIRRRINEQWPPVGPADRHSALSMGRRIGYLIGHNRQKVEGAEFQTALRQLALNLRQFVCSQSDRGQGTSDT